MGTEDSDSYKTLYLGKGEISETPASESPPVVLGPVIDDLSKFHPVGWYASIRVRRHWFQLWKPKTKVVWGKLKDPSVDPPD